MQKRHNSIANALELLLCCINQLICSDTYMGTAKQIAIYAQKTPVYFQKWFWVSK